MSLLSGSRTRLDSIIYWAIFFIVALFMTYFLNSMINMSNAEDHDYTTATLVGYSHQNARLHEQREEKELKTEDGEPL